MSLNYEFSKSEKKIARQVIETGLQRDYETSILDLDQIIQRWKNKELPVTQKFFLFFRLK